MPRTIAWRRALVQAVPAVRIRALLLCLGASALAACGSNGLPATAPTTPSVPATLLNIAGQTILSVGMTSQLTARALDGTTVSGVTWTTATPSVATVSPTGVVTAVAEGAATIAASAAAVNGHGSVTVLVQQNFNSTITLTTCTNITSPGHYVVDRDMPNTSPCFNISSVAGVQLDCQGHSLRAIVLDHASHTTIANCMVAANIKMTSADDVTVSGSTITNGILWAIQSTNVVFTENTLRTVGTGIGVLVVLDSGSNNRVRHNTLTGGYDGGRSDVGVDDGVVLYNESGDVVEDNSISNFYDAGIEGVGALSGTRLTNNTMTNLGVAGVATYWCTAWTNNVVQGNGVTSAPMLVRILYDTGSKCNGPIVPAAFSGNQFVGNVFRDRAPGTSGASRGPAISIVMPGVVESNLLQGNDLGTADGPFLSPLGGFIDGGGNLCGPLDRVYTNFVCSAGTTRRVKR